MEPYEDKSDHFDDKVFLKIANNVFSLGDSAKEMLLRISRKNYTIMLSDGYDGDFLVQHFLNIIGYRNVEIFAMGEQVRFNVGKWPVHKVQPPSYAASEEAFYQLEYSAMCDFCKHAVIIADSKEALDTNAELLTIRSFLKEKRKKFIFTQNA